MVIYMEEMKRGLKTRHISMIAIGGSIGTGLFMASGAVITQAGPAGALIAYAIIGVMLYFLMTAIGELATFYPVSGSFSAYSSRFIDPSAGFTVGWLYWIIWALVSSVDILTAAKIITYWNIFDSIDPFVWSMIFIVIFKKACVQSFLKLGTTGKTACPFLFIKMPIKLMVLQKLTHALLSCLISIILVAIIL